MTTGSYDTDPMFRYIRNWLDHRTIAQASITPAEWDAAFASLPLLDGLSGQEKSTLQDVGIAEDARGHGERGAQLMANILPARSLFCIRYHAESKIYLCQTNLNYRAGLAGASVKTLAVQSANYHQARLDELSGHRWWQDALRVRVWDDTSKEKGRETRPLGYWIDRLEKFMGEIHPQ